MSWAGAAEKRKTYSSATSFCLNSRVATSKSLLYSLCNIHFAFALCGLITKRRQRKGSEHCDEDYFRAHLEVLFNAKGRVGSIGQINSLFWAGFPMLVSWNCNRRSEQTIYIQSLPNDCSQRPGPSGFSKARSFG